MSCKAYFSLQLNGVATQIQVLSANSYWLRLKGWMFKKAILDSDALWIQPCNSIHTFFMRCAIDVIFINSQGQVVRCCECVMPWSGRVSLSALSVLELKAGMIAALNIKVGDSLAIMKNGYEK